MTDQELVELFWQRREEALTGLQDKYGGWCRSIAGRILGKSGTWRSVWGTAGSSCGTPSRPPGPSTSGAIWGRWCATGPCSSAGGGDGRGTRSLWPLWSWLSASPAGRGPRSRPRRRSWGGPSPPSWESWGRGRVPPSCGGTGTQTPWRRPPAPGLVAVQDQERPVSDAEEAESLFGTGGNVVNRGERMMEAVGLVDPALVEQAGRSGPAAQRPAGPCGPACRRLPVCGPAGVGVGGQPDRRVPVPEIF